MMAFGGAAIVAMNNLRRLRNNRPRCSKCGQVIQPQTPESGWDVVIGLAIIFLVLVVFVWAMFTIVQWAQPLYGEPSNPTLVHVIHEQWLWLVSLAHRIY